VSVALTFAVLVAESRGHLALNTGTGRYMSAFGIAGPSPDVGIEAKTARFREWANDIVRKHDIHFNVLQFVGDFLRRGVVQTLGDLRPTLTEMMRSYISGARDDLTMHAGEFGVSLDVMERTCANAMCKFLNFDFEELQKYEIIGCMNAFQLSDSARYSIDDVQLKAAFDLLECLEMISTLIQGGGSYVSLVGEHMDNPAVALPSRLSAAEILKRARYTNATDDSASVFAQASAHKNRGTESFREGRFDQAERHYALAAAVGKRAAATLDTTKLVIACRANRALCLLHLDRPDDAEREAAVGLASSATAESGIRRKLGIRRLAALLRFDPLADERTRKALEDARRTHGLSDAEILCDLRKCPHGDAIARTLETRLVDFLDSTAISLSNAASTPIEHVGLLEPTPEQHRMIEEQFAEKWDHPEKPLPRILRVWTVRNSPVRQRAFEDHQAAVEATLGEVSRPPFSVKRDDNGEEYREVMRADAVENVLANTRRRFHGTSSACDIGRDASRRIPCRDVRCVVCSILRTGFRLPIPEGQELRFGYGIYTTATSSKAHTYTNQSVRVRAMFVVHVVAGNTCNRVDTWTQEDMQLTAPPPGFDSVLGRVAANWEGGAVDDAGYKCAKARHTLNYDELVTYTPDANLPAFLILYDSHDCADILESNLEIQPNVHHSVPRSIAGGFGRHPSQTLTAGWETWPQVESGDWGFVFITEGACQGQFAYYDDEDHDDAYEGEGAIIYLGQPLIGEQFCVPLRWLRKPPFDAPIKAL
jgi:hypothetical protein